MRNSWKTLAASALLTSLLAVPAMADPYTCDDNKPCIIDASEAGHYRVRLVWSGQGTEYDYYKIIVRLHGGGEEKSFRVKGNAGGKGKFNLHQPGDYEITVAGCYGPKSSESCRPSSEKVRMNLH
jgi:hypothetical protein